MTPKMKFSALKLGLVVGSTSTVQALQCPPPADCKLEPWELAAGHLTPCLDKRLECYYAAVDAGSKPAFEAFFPSTTGRREVAWMGNYLQPADYAAWVNFTQMTTGCSEVSQVIVEPFHPSKPGEWPREYTEETISDSIADHSSEALQEHLAGEAEEAGSEAAEAGLKEGTLAVGGMVKAAVVNKLNARTERAPFFRATLKFAKCQRDNVDRGLGDNEGWGETYGAQGPELRPDDPTDVVERLYVLEGSGAQMNALMASAFPDQEGEKDDLKGHTLAHSKSQWFATKIFSRVAFSGKLDGGALWNQAGAVFENAMKIQNFLTKASKDKAKFAQMLEPHFSNDVLPIRLDRVREAKRAEAWEQAVRGGEEMAAAANPTVLGKLSKAMQNTKLWAMGTDVEKDLFWQPARQLGLNLRALQTPENQKLLLEELEHAMEPPKWSSCLALVTFLIEAGDAAAQSAAENPDGLIPITTNAESIRRKRSAEWLSEETRELLKGEEKSEEEFEKGELIEGAEGEPKEANLSKGNNVADSLRENREAFLSADKVIGGVTNTLVMGGLLTAAGTTLGVLSAPIVVPSAGAVALTALVAGGFAVGGAALSETLREGLGYLPGIVEVLYGTAGADGKPVPRMLTVATSSWTNLERLQSQSEEEDFVPNLHKSAKALWDACVENVKKQDAAWSLKAAGKSVSLVKMHKEKKAHASCFLGALAADNGLKKSSGSEQSILQKKPSIWWDLLGPESGAQYKLVTCAREGEEAEK